MRRRRCWVGNRPDAREGEPAGWSVRVRLATTSTAAAARGRTEAAVVGLLAAGDRSRRQRHQPLETGVGASRAGHLLLIPDQLLEFGAAPGAAVIVNGHERASPMP